MSMYMMLVSSTSQPPLRLAAAGVVGVDLACSCSSGSLYQSPAGSTAPGPDPAAPCSDSGSSGSGPGNSGSDLVLASAGGLHAPVPLVLVLENPFSRHHLESVDLIIEFFQQDWVIRADMFHLTFSPNFNMC